MKIIRDNELNGIMMIPLLTQWNVKRCNLKDCTNKPTTIITETAAGVFGMCENHYQEAQATKGKFKIKLEFS